MPLLLITVSPLASAPLLLFLNSQSDLTMGTNWIRRNAHENKDNKSIFVKGKIEFLTCQVAEKFRQTDVKVIGIEIKIMNK
jgi:hypothetical protein